MLPGDAAGDRPHRATVGTDPAALLRCCVAMATLERLCESPSGGKKKNPHFLKKIAKKKGFAVFICVGAAMRALSGQREGRP